jgi:hypothetical protein
MVVQQRLEFSSGRAPCGRSGTNLHSDGQMVAARGSHPVNRERHEADVLAQDGRWTVTLVTPNDVAGALPQTALIGDPYAPNSSINAFASFRSRVSKPSVNQP